MENKRASGQIQIGYFVAALASCKTILQSAVKISCLLPILTLALTACNNKTENHTHNPPPDYTGTNMSGGGGNGGGVVTGTGDGGGGQGVYCSDKVKDPRFKGKVLVRDIFEAIRDDNRTMKSIPNDVSGTDTVSPEAIKVLVDSLKHFYGPASVNLEFVNEKFWTDFVKKIHFLDEDYTLHPSQDANSAIALPNECKIVQIAFWEESEGVNNDGILYIKQSLWNKLNHTSKIGLLAHELFFKQARKAGYKNSDFVRTKVGELLSVKGLNPIFLSWDPSPDLLVKQVLPRKKEGYKYCKATNSTDPSANADLYQYEGSDGKQHIVIMNLTSQNISASSLSFTQHSFEVATNFELAAGLDLIGLAKDFKNFNIKENRFDRLLNNKYENSGLISIDKKSKQLDIRSNIQRSFSALSRKAVTEIWNGHMSSAGGLIRVGISNPGLGYERNDLKMLSEEQIRATVYDLIGAKLQRCATDISSDHDWLVSLLNAEIEEASLSARYPLEFVKWEKALLDLYSKYKSQTDSRYNQECDIDRDSVLLVDIPKFFYKLKIKNVRVLDTQNFFSIVRSSSTGSELTILDGLNLDWQPFYIKTGKLIINKDSYVEELELNCESFQDVFDRETSTKNSLKSREFEKQDIAISYDNNLKPLSQNKDVSFLFNHFFDQLSSREIQKSILLGELAISNCTETSRLTTSCAELREFIKEISVSSSIQFSMCSENLSARAKPFYSKLNGVNYLAGCVVVHPSFSKRRYLVRFENIFNIDEYNRFEDLRELTKRSDKRFNYGLEIVYLRKLSSSEVD